MTINISLPKSMYADAEAALTQRHYMSFSELVRDAMRKFLYPQLTENGFTPEVEEEILKIAATPVDNDVVWDGKTDPVKFALGHQPNSHDSNSKNGKVLNGVKNNSRAKS